MEGKKISFGFMKTKKVEKTVVEEKKDFIECVEEKSIKVVGGDEVKEITPLIIPMKPNTLVTSERLKQIAEKVESALEETGTVEKADIAENPVENETLDQMAVRELLQDAKKEIKIETPMLTVPLPAKPVNEGEKESTLDDYESVPVQDFGMAMLRGMGWSSSKEKSAYKPPQLRPKGLGLGADKVVKSNQKQKSNKDSKEEELGIVKNAFVKITTGKYSGYYGKVVSLDEDNGRVMVDIAVKKETVSLSEFMMHPVSKSEFDKESKVINAGSYEEYKKKETTQKSSILNKREDTPEKNTSYRDHKEDKQSQREGTSSKNTESKHDREESSRYIEKDRSSKNGKDHKDNQDEKKEKERDRSHRSRQRRNSRDERYSRKKDIKYSSNESLDSLSDSERKRYKKKERKRYSSQDSLSSQSDNDRKKKDKKKARRGYDSSDSESEHRSKKNNKEGKRDIDKKRKGKKKKRDRDRSPNYRKHRK